ncbi:hypothetical protein [Shewanella sp. Isolate11]|uniref:hypothetical protein n=1 Tax=Shewanella sp. Isolate11 TaxID=2908530 RepID=UPI001EFDAE2B|nr:hypothetical protein [Shewanella sp. Isolate11]MCG9695695.1 hypothetical protein [Shewanella sp. Isolate11]
MRKRISIMTSESLVAILALLLLLVATQVFTQNVSSWFLFGLHISEMADMYQISREIPRLPDVANMGGDITQCVLDSLRLLQAFLK